MPSVLLLTSTNLTCNPRCHKELQLLLQQGFRVTLVAFRLNNWSEPVEAQLRLQYPAVQFHYLDTTRQGHALLWLMSAVLEAIARKTAGLFPRWWWLQALSVSRRSWLILRWTNRLRERPSLVIAHNPAAFYPAWCLSLRKKMPFALDIEDFHPGEDNPPAERESVTRLMQHLLPISMYNSYAAPLIMQHCFRLAAPLDKFRNVLVNNSFSAHAFRLPDYPLTADTVELVWFSQVVDFRRGLERVLPVLDRFPAGTFKLTLIGDLRAAFYEQELKTRAYITCTPALPQEMLLEHLSAFDAGLAIEFNPADLNRNLCLTNKIWSYLQAGLFIAATGTDAQRAFLEAHPGHGLVTTDPEADFYPVLQYIQTHIKEIRQGREQRFLAARAFAWEQESKSLLGFWQSLPA